MVLNRKIESGEGIGARGTGPPPGPRQRFLDRDGRNCFGSLRSHALGSKVDKVEIQDNQMTTLTKKADELSTQISAVKDQIKALQTSLGSHKVVPALKAPNRYLNHNHEEHDGDNSKQKLHSFRVLTP
jgi:hypothetical protein